MSSKRERRALARKGQNNASAIFSPTKVTATRVTRTEVSIPLPSPELLEELRPFVPDAGERFMADYDASRAHAREMDSLQLNGIISGQRQSFQLAVIGICATTVIVLAVVGAIAYCAAIGAPGIAWKGILGSLAVLGVAVLKAALGPRRAKDREE